MDQELDESIAARIAKLLVEQYCIRKQKLGQQRTVHFTAGFLRKLIEDLNHNKDKLYLDDFRGPGSDTQEHRQQTKRLTKVSNMVLEHIYKMEIPHTELYQEPEKVIK